jgi:3-oxoacid CoA-transferase B subunit
MADMKVRETIAKNIAPMLHDGELVNLGVGMPTMVGNFVDPSVHLLFHGENGTVGASRQLPNDMCETPEKFLEWEDAHSGFKSDHIKGHKDLVNAGSYFITLDEGSCCFGLATSFAIARGGHLDATVLGALQVDQSANLANWLIPGKRENGMGGAMDILSGAKRAIIAMEHLTRDGKPKLLAKCTLPLTAVHCVDTVVTEKCVVGFNDEGFVVKAMYPGVTREELLETIEGHVSFADDVKEMLTV